MAIHEGRIQLLADSLTNWTASNPILLAGEIGVANAGSMSPIFKCGDGVRPWNNLPSMNAPVTAAQDYVVGTTITLPPGSDATVVIDNAVDPPTISFGIPRGDVGATGPPNILSVGSTTTSAPGSDAEVTITGTSPAQVLHFVIPRGEQGPQGIQGIQGPPNVLSVGTVTTGAPGSAASATITGTSPAQVLNLTIPRGDTGAQGIQGVTGATGPPNVLSIGTVTTGAPGDPASATITGTSPAQVLNLSLPKGDQGPQGIQGIQGIQGPAGSAALANPSKLVGLTVKNGTGGFAMYADSAPAIDQAITPTWTGRHKFALATAADSAWLIGATVNDTVFLPMYRGDGTTRRGYVGWVTGASGRLSIINEEAASDIVLTTPGGVGINGAPVNSYFEVFGNESAYPVTKAFQRLTNASATGQTAFDFTIGGTFRGRVRCDYNGNLNHVANGGDHVFFTGGDSGTGAIRWRVGATGEFVGNGKLQSSGWDGNYYAGLAVQVGISSGYAYFHCYNNSTASYGPVRIQGSQYDFLPNTASSTSIYITSRLAISTQDTSWLRLNQNADFASGVYTPGLIRADGGFKSDAGLSGQNYAVVMRPNDLTTYGSFLVSGAKGTYHGLCVYDGGLNPTFMSNGTNIGLFLNGEAWLLMRASATAAQISYNLSLTNGTSYYAMTASSFNAVSTRAIKKETGAPSRAATMLRRLRPIFYKLLADGKKAKEQLGLVAEEVHKICPQLSDGKTVSYDRLALLLLADWQEKNGSEAL